MNFDIETKKHSGKVYVNENEPILPFTCGDHGYLEHVQHDGKNATIQQDQSKRL